MYVAFGDGYLGVSTSTQEEVDHVSAFTNVPVSSIIGLDFHIIFYLI